MEQQTLFSAIDSQKRRLLQHLKQGNSVTSLDALRLFGCLSLAQRVFDLKKEGHFIKREMVKTPNGKRVGSYSYVKKN